ncbi:MAG TPA: hypothetical protein VHZ75_08885 [Solirubrobacteraceae bacterium]|nr:hypothetical protein [Solirubrobacteraceae bacterium]
MPDFLAALEHELRAAATPAAPATRRRPARRLVIAAAVVMLIATSFMLATGPGGRDATQAFAGPPILREPTVAVPERLRTLGAGALYMQRLDNVAEPASSKDLQALLASGRRIPTETARQIPAFGGTAYLLGAPGVWCLTAPDPATRHPDIEVGETCVPAREFTRIGMAMTIGRHYVAAIPQGVPDPVLTRADGASTTLRPDRHGLVVIDTLAAGDTVTRSDAQGLTSVDR